MKREDNILLAKRNIVDSIYSESKLEGIAVTFPETQQIYEGRNVAGLSVEDIVKVNNLKHAWQFLLDTIDYPMDLRYIRQLNSEVGAGIVYDAGRVRTASVRITGTDWIPEIPDYEAAEAKIREIMESSLSWTEKAMDVMLYVMRSQLFFDGNKRTAQLAANQILIQNGKGLIHIPVERQKEFLNMLVDYYESGKGQKIKKFLYEASVEGIEASRIRQPEIDKRDFYRKK
ncbi:MAG: Fic family protein [Lachnospiraceae bacterium]|nr:Fic family protein [Lachnospiraceae bacterium]